MQACRRGVRKQGHRVRLIPAHCSYQYPFSFFRCFEVKEGGPVWGKRCTHCMACICGCPAEAIEYGKRTVGKRRYYNEGYNAGNMSAGK